MENPHQLQSRKALNPNERKNRIARTETALSMKVLCILRVDVQVVFVLFYGLSNVEIGFSSRFTIFIVNLVQELSESATVKMQVNAPLTEKTWDEVELFWS